jgi:hypothetical protein
LVAKTVGDEIGGGDSSPKIDPKRKEGNGSRKYSEVRIHLSLTLI